MAVPPFYVAVIGPGEATSQQLTWAREVGTLLAGEHITVVCGGLGGCMEAVAHGTRDAGGVCIGVLPDGDRRRANASLTYSLPTGLGEARNVLVVRAADVVVAIGGGAGTLSEMAMAWKLGTPVIGLDTWEVTAPPGTAPEVTCERVRTPHETLDAVLRHRRSRDA